eukprot:scaffold20456_cov47-Phaeocystis_antarctica.AAC.1
MANLACTMRLAARPTLDGVRVRVRAKARVRFRVGARVRARVSARVRVRVRVRVNPPWRCCRRSRATYLPGS